TSGVGGSVRQILENVSYADTSVDGNEVAIVRHVGDRDRLEFPIGSVLYETAGYISHPRISRSGDAVAFLEHPLPSDNRGWVTVVTRSGEHRKLTDEFSGEDGLAWSADGREIWFSASPTGRNVVQAVTRAGKNRLVWETPSDLSLLDIATDGRVLVTANAFR